jgi:FKBP-type peptidyl-prolyl cis-trans isomerase
MLGWDAGIGQLCKGEKATLYISSDYAYGKGGYPPSYPNCTFSLSFCSSNF